MSKKMKNNILAGLLGFIQEQLREEIKEHLLHTKYKDYGTNLNKIKENIDNYLNKHEGDTCGFTISKPKRLPRKLKKRNKKNNVVILNSTYRLPINCPTITFKATITKEGFNFEQLQNIDTRI